MCLRCEQNIYNASSKCLQHYLVIELFADDCLIYQPILTPADHHILQEDLQKLFSWAEKFKMKFNISKCCIMKLSKHHHKSEFPYSMSGQDLQIVEQHPYLGVIIDHQLSWKPHVDYSNETDRISESQIVRLLKNIERIELQTVCVTKFRLDFICLEPLLSG